jgi:hypothetical protein
VTRGFDAVRGLVHLSTFERAATMIHDLRPAPIPAATDDLQALRAQIEDAIPYRDGVLTYEQALALLNEVERLRRAVGERDMRITQLMGILS